jgi:hypothetical protein
MILKGNIELTHNDHDFFLDLSLYNGLDTMIVILFSACAPVYPFRFMLLIARFKFSAPIKDHVNTVFRTLPGVLVYLVIILFIALGWSLGYWM